MRRKMVLCMTMSTVAALLGITLAGCDGKTTIKGGSGEGIHVEAPGVKVDVGGGQGVQIETPGSKVGVDDKGVRVDVPNAKVDVSEDKGVQVETPNANVDLGGKK